MKRSEINRIISKAKEFFHQCRFHLPPWAFWSPEDWKDKGKVPVGEVSSVNDDKTDNCFTDGIGRFPSIVEDENPIHLLASDYPNYI